MSTSTQTDATISLNSSRFSFFGSRWVPVLALLLLIQLAVTAAVYWPRNSSTTAGEPLLADFAPDKVQGLTVTDGNDKQLHAVRKDGGWVLPDAGDFPVKDEKVTAILDAIAGLKRDRLVGTKSSTLTQLSVADAKFTRRIGLEMVDGSQQTVYVGDGPRYGTSHVRLGGESNAYLSLDFSTNDSATRVADWIDASYLHIAEASVQKMTLENSTGVFSFARDDQGQWQMEGLADGEVFNDNNLISMLTTLSSLNMAEPLGKEAKPEYGLDKPTARVTLEYKDDAGNVKQAELKVGALDSTSTNYTVSFNESPYYVAVPKYSLERFVTRAREEFLQQPPTPTAAP